MTRNSAGAVSSIVLTLMLASGGVASAQVGLDRGNPFGDILTMLRSIQNQNAQVDSQLLKHLQDLRRQLDQLEAGQRPQPSAHRVWVAPLWYETATSRGPSGAHTYAFNPGRFDADVRVIYFDRLTHSSRVARGTAHGGNMTIDLASVAGDFPSLLRGGWVVVASDRPVLPYGWFSVGSYADDDRNDLAMQFYPIDCSNPADETVSIACSYADPASDPPQN